MAGHQMAMDLSAAMDVDVGVSLDMSSLHNTLDVMGNQVPLNHVDDLFGDSLGMEQMQGPTISKPLLQRLDELRTRGCCQGIAWSRQGTIASIASDGRSIDLRFLRCHPTTGAWEISQPTPCLVLSPVLANCPIVHIAWASTSSPDIAVIDSVGRVFILTFSIALNRSYVARKWDNDPVDDLNAVVGCYWLPTYASVKDRWGQLVSYSPAVRTGDGKAYEFRPTLVPCPKPFHPNVGKSALLCVTTNGFLKLYFAQNNTRIEESTIEMDSVFSSDDLITHASLTSDMDLEDPQNGYLHIALATASKQLKVVRVDIDWGIPQVDKDKKQQVPGMSLDPKMTVTNVAIDSWFEYGPHPSRLNIFMTQLSHIEILPKTPRGSYQPNTNQPPEQWCPPLILTVRSYVPDEESPFNQEQESIVDCWELQNRPQKLHPIFAQLGNGPGNSLPNATRLHKVKSLVFTKVVVSLQATELGKVVCFVFSDGSMKHYNRITLDEMYTESDLSRVRGPAGAGFEFTQETPCLQTAFSPTYSSIVQICEDSKVKWICPSYTRIDEVGTSMEDNLYSSVVAALSVPMASAAIYGTFMDDILALARPFALRHEQFASDWAMELAQMLKVQVDFSSEDANKDSLIRNEKLLTCFTILYHLGFHGEFKRRSFGSKFAMLAMNLRNCDIMIHCSINSPTRFGHTLSPLDEPIVVEMLSSCGKWFFDLLAYLTDSLFSLRDDPEFLAIINNQTRFWELTKFLQSQKNVALHLLLCSSTRTFLLLACRQYTHFYNLSLRAVDFHARAVANNSIVPSQEALCDAYRKMTQHSANALVKLADFEKLIRQLSQEIRSGYEMSLPGLTGQGKQANGQQGQQGSRSKPHDDPMKKALDHCELSLLLARPPPPSFQKVLQNFFQHVNEFWGQTNPLKICFADYSLLEVEEDEKALAKKKAQGYYVDVFRRCRLNAADRIGIVGDTPTSALAPEVLDKQWRRCVRCAAVMQNISGIKAGVTFVLAQQRKCACGGCWGLLHIGQMAS